MIFFKIKPVLQSVDLGLLDDGSPPSSPYSLYHWLNEVDEEDEDDF